jgi:tetratricopeptide (TPR) repeat protein
MCPSSPITNALILFYSYAHEDELLRNDLDKQLSLLKRHGDLSTWYDRNISAGTEWAHEIDIRLESADIILLLISADFLASDYCYSIEMERAMQRHETRQSLVIPVILRPTLGWEDALFGKLQALPTGAKPVTSWPDRDEALLNVAQGIRKAVQDLRARRAAMLSSAPTTTASHTGPLAPTSMLWNVPFPRNPFFTGRETILTDLHRTLTSNQRAAITQPQAISGLGGIGKTQTAIEYAYRYQQDYKAVLWVRSSTREELIADLLAIATLLHLPEKDAQDQSIIVNAVKGWLETHTRWLLIFDNADDLDLLREFAPVDHSGHILLTTRAQTMSGLAHKVDVASMGRDEGALLLLRRAGLITVDATLADASETDRSAAFELVQALDGLPLALDQAGAYIEETRSSLSGYLTLYRVQRAKLLAWRGGRAFEHPAPVATTWSLSFEKIEQANPAASDLLRLCAYLAADAIPEELFTEGATELGPVLQPVAADAFALNLAIRDLLNYSLVERDPATQTLSIHRLVQAVLKDAMDQETRHQWAERTVKAVDAAFPSFEFEDWPRCQRLLPHAQACAVLIEQWDLTFSEAARLLNEAGRYLGERGQYREALPLYQRALAINEQVLGHEHPDTATSLNNLAVLYDAQGNYSEALPLYQRALAIYEQVLGPEHPKTALSLNNLAYFYHNQGNYSEALPLYQRALAIREKVLGPEHPNTATSLNNLAYLYHAKGKYEEALPLLQRALTIREKVLGLEHPDTAQSLNNLAALYDAQGKYEEALPLYQRALTIREKVLGPEHPDTAQSLNNLAALYDAQGKYEEALPLYQRALTIREKVLGLEHPSTKRARENYTALLEQLRST